MMNRKARYERVSGTRTPKGDVRISVTFTEYEWNKLNRLAHEFDKPVSAFIHDACMEGL